VGLNLKNSIVIVDEAHNLLETITNIHRLPSYSFAKKTIKKQCFGSGTLNQRYGSEDPDPYPY
jgi:hypothetical protein